MSSASAKTTKHSSNIETIFENKELTIDTNKTKSNVQEKLLMKPSQNVDEKMPLQTEPHNHQNQAQSSVNIDNSTAFDNW